MKKSRTRITIAGIVSAVPLVILIFFLARRLPEFKQTFGAILLLLGGAGTSALLIWFVPRIQVSYLKANLKPEELFDRENEARKTLAQVLGGALVLTGLYFSWRNLVVTQTTTEGSLSLSRESLVTSEISEGFKALGAEGVATKVGGLYSLARIAKDSPRDHWPIMETIMAFVRQTSPWKPPSSGEPPKCDPTEPPDQLIYARVPPSDLQAAMYVISQRRWDYEEGNGQYVQLYATNLRRVNLTGAHLEEASFIGSDLKGAILSSANLKNAKFNNADLSYIISRRSDFDGADLTDACLLNASLDESTFRRTKLVRAHLEGLNLEKVDGLTWEQVREACVDDGTLLPVSLQGRRVAEPVPPCKQ